ncbi:MAG: HutD/Ves family protein [Paracoccaceae bacterium]
MGNRQIDMHFDSTKLTPVPWKNKGGVTRPLAADGTKWRLSLADITKDGPFSTFPGWHRILTIVRGKGLILSNTDLHMTANPWQPLAFDGATPLAGALIDGPAQAFNLMYDPDQVSAQLVRLEPGAHHAPAALSVIFVGAGQVQTDSACFTAGKGGVIRPDANVSAAPDTRALLVLIDPA